MRKLFLAAAAVSMVAPVIPTPALAHDGYRGKIWTDSKGRQRCKRPDGTTGLIVGGAAGAQDGEELNRFSRRGGPPPPQSEALEFESAAHGESHTWRATKEFALLGEILGSFEWGALDLLMFDLPPGAERTVQYAEFLGPRTSFLLVTIPSEVARGVVARSVAALSKGPNRVLGYVENMSGYYCRDCNAIKPLFVSSSPSDMGIPCLGTVPFDPELARHCDRGFPLAELANTPVGHALEHVAQQLLDSLGTHTKEPRP